MNIKDEPFEQKKCFLGIRMSDVENRKRMILLIFWKEEFNIWKERVENNIKFGIES